MRGIAHVSLVGNVANDPELKTTRDGTAYCKFSLCVNYPSRDENGNYAEEPNYFDIIAWGDTGHFACNHLPRGGRVSIDGYLKQHRWTDMQGDKRTRIEIVAKTILPFDYKETAGTRTDRNPRQYDVVAC
jgi:single-strand DNA-binding protein